MSDLNFTEKRIETDNGKICYFSNRQFENRPTIIFLHGLSSNHTTWNAPMEALEKLGLNSLAPDLRGHGHSDKTKKRDLYKFPVFTEDIDKIIEKEKLEKIILVGYSFGGFIALDYVIKHPKKVSALILISANHVNPLKYKKIGFLTWPAYGLANALAWLLLWQKRKNYYYYNQEEDLGYWRSTLKGLTTMPISINLWMLSEAAHLDFSRDISKIGCPVLIIKSRSDSFVSETEARDMTQKIKSVKLITLDENTHFLASRYQEKIVDVIANFLREKGII